MGTEDTLLRSLAIISVTDCLADATKNRVMAEFSDDVSPVFPYLNAIVPKLLYNPAANAITIKRSGRLLTFYPHVAMLAKVNGKEDAIAQLLWFQNLCNDTWRKRKEITPSYVRRRLLGPLDVYTLLPKLNCKACGEATCMAFGFGLLFEEHHLKECPPLQNPEYAEGGRRLTELLG